MQKRAPYLHPSHLLNLYPHSYRPDGKVKRQSQTVDHYLVRVEDVGEEGEAEGDCLWMGRRWTSVGLCVDDCNWSC